MPTNPRRVSIEGDGYSRLKLNLILVDELERERQDFDITDYLDDDDIPAYRLNAGNTSSDDEHRGSSLRFRCKFP